MRVVTCSSTVNRYKLFYFLTIGTSEHFDILQRFPLSILQKSTKILQKTFGPEVNGIIDFYPGPISRVKVDYGL